MVSALPRELAAQRECQMTNGRIFLGVFIFRYFFIGRESEYLMYFGLTTLGTSPRVSASDS